MRIVLVAEEAAGMQVLRALEQRDDEVVAVMARADKTSAAGASVWDVARAMGHQTWPAEEVRLPTLAHRLRELDIDVVLNVHSLYVVHGDALDVPRFGWYNLHPGLLPEYAGLNTVSWAICRGERTHGVTIHRMAPRVDAGAICYQERFAITQDDTGLSLSAKCVRVGVRLILDLVEALGRDPASVPSIQQDPAAIRYFRRDELPGDGRFTWAQPAQHVTDFIRAFDYYPLSSPWGHPRARVAGSEVGVIGASRAYRRTDALPGTVEPSDDGAVLVACGDEWVRIRRLSRDGHIRDAVSILDTSNASLREGA